MNELILFVGGKPIASAEPQVLEITESKSWCEVIKKFPTLEITLNNRVQKRDDFIYYLHRNGRYYFRNLRGEKIDFGYPEYSEDLSELKYGDKVTFEFGIA